MMSNLIEENIPEDVKELLGGEDAVEEEDDNSDHEDAETMGKPSKASAPHDAKHKARKKETSPTPANILTTLADQNSLQSIWDAMPGYSINHRWEVFNPQGKEIGCMRCIQGASLRMDCRIHARKDNPPQKICKMHCDIHTS